MKLDKLSFKEKLELIDTTLSIILSVAAIIGFLAAYQSEFGKIFKELIIEMHKEYVIAKKEL